MPVLQPIVNLAELLYQKGVTDVIVSPGSRSAPLTLAVARHPKLRVRVIADERSAGFIALGLAQQCINNRQPRPVAIICTSGSAVYNLAPAIAEAYFQEIPLVLLTADRPREWVHQQDGQTIFQAGIFGQHVKRSYDLPADYGHPDARWYIERSVNEALNLSGLTPLGPVHVNVPLREPFYPKEGETFHYEPVRIIDALPVQPELPASVWHQLLREWEGAERKLIAVGQMSYHPELTAILQKISDELAVPVVGEIISNLHQNGVFITQSDTFLSSAAGEDWLQKLRPELLITCGHSFLTRNLKTFLRKNSAPQHWHIQPSADRIVDSFQSLTKLIPTGPLYFFEKLFADLDYQRFLQGDEDEEEQEFLQRWQNADRRAGKLVQDALRPAEPFVEWAAVQTILEQLPQHSILHLANSMPVRYANLCGIRADQQIAVSANRGTSGIDGCLSTAVGAALATDQIVTIFVGDVAFFYDRNALWNPYLPANLRIVLFNNHGGHIFRMIDGSAQQPELETYFETEQPLSGRASAEEAGIDYRSCRTTDELLAALTGFFDKGSTARLLEVFTDKRVNADMFQPYKAQVKQQFGGR
ncbi:2-succinyl-5-enolpyruvyl-6-hydroxy-3-cyclohexene- 1-carboxylic-acid synthase [Nibrella saemangeumensis]|uniref:2-succinyl-5-enolpyruvyl-6-hydroxy-3-cyclohexene-1-carboxylate synthase n=1 Tax=Nibrella saemangeumensis TaxID=1084526 RepID=A0ABP8MJR1_9BACT